MLHTLQVGSHWFPEHPGGIERYYYELIRHLPAVGVACCGLVAGGDHVADGSGGGVRAFASSSAPLWVRCRRVRAEARQRLASGDVQLVVSHFALYAAPVVDLLRRRVPLVAHFQGPWALEAEAQGAGRLTVQTKLAVERYVYRRAALCIVMSRAFGGILARAYGVPAARIHVVPGGVEAERFASAPPRARCRALLGWPADRRIVLAVRRLVPRMGLPHLVAAMAALRRVSPDVLLVIAGHGPLAGQLASQVRSEGLEHHVRLLGRVADDHLPLAYRAADLTVVPSVALEGFGLVVVESLAAGTPALVAPVGGLPEVVRELSPDLVLPDGRPPTIAATLGAALQGHLTLPDAAACERFARRHYNWPTIADRVRALYEQAMWQSALA